MPLGIKVTQEISPQLPYCYGPFNQPFWAFPGLMALTDSLRFQHIHAHLMFKKIYDSGQAFIRPGFPFRIPRVQVFCGFPCKPPMLEFFGIFSWGLGTDLIFTGLYTCQKIKFLPYATFRLSQAFSNRCCQRALLMPHHGFQLSQGLNPETTGLFFHGFFHRHILPATLFFWPHSR